MAAPKHEVNVRMQGAIKFALEQVAQVRPLDPVTFVAEKLLEYDRKMDEREQELKSSGFGLEEDEDPAFFLLGRSFEEEELLAAIRAAVEKGELLEEVASALGDDPSGFVTVTLRGLRGHKFLAPVLQELSRLMTIPDAQVLGTMSLIASAHSDMFETGVLVQAFAATTAAASSVEVRRLMGCAYASAIASGRIEYDPAVHRPLASDISLQGAFLSACCLQDHEWFLDNKLELLGDSPSTLVPMLSATCEGLTGREIRQLLRELLSEGHTYSEKAAAEIEATMQEASFDAHTKGDLMRWAVHNDY